MSLLTVNGISVNFGEETLLTDINFSVQSSDKVALVGVNGCGKTTLFKLICNVVEKNNNFDIADTSGTISISCNIGYMEQHVVRESSISVYEETLSVFAPLIEMEEELERLHKAIDTAPTEALIARSTSLSEEYQVKGGLTFRARTRSALEGVSFDSEFQGRQVSVLSGGEKSKVQLVKLLLSGAELLLLDEPTNHLDITACLWLEKFLTDYSGAYIVISHDRYFLDKVTNKTFEIENRRLTAYNGSYSRFLLLKEEKRTEMEKVYGIAIEEIARIEAIIVQQRRFNRERNFITIASKEKQIERIRKTLVPPPPAPRKFHFIFNCDEGCGNDVLLTNDISLQFDGKNVFKNCNLDIKKGEKVFLLGNNGCGKTSLLKVIMGQITDYVGRVKFGARVKLGYFDQIQSGLDETKTTINELWDTYPRMTETEVRTALGGFLFRNDDVFKGVSKLSGGEKARLSLLKLMLSGSNFLLLDEPTNHLDITSKEALEDALIQYPGTLLIVSHDRYLINKVATRIYNLKEDGAESYNGGYDSFLESQMEDTASVPEVLVLKENKYKRNRQNEALERRQKANLRKLESLIDEKEAEVVALTEKLSTEEVMADYEQLMEITGTLERAQADLDGLMEEWLGAESAE